MMRVVPSEDRTWKTQASSGPGSPRRKQSSHASWAACLGVSASRSISQLTLWVVVCAGAVFICADLLGKR